MFMLLANIAVHCLSHSASSPCKQRESKYADSICLMILLAHFCYLRTASEHSWLNGGIKSLITMQLDKKKIKQSLQPQGSHQISYMGTKEY